MKPRLATLVARNLIKRPFRHGAILIAVAAVAGLQAAAVIIETGARSGIELSVERLGADLVAVPDELGDSIERSWMTGEAETTYMDRAVIDKIKSFSFVARTSPQVYLHSLKGASCCSAGNIFLVGFDPKTDFTVRPWLEARGKDELTGDNVLAGSAMWVSPGDTLRFYGRVFTVEGKLAETGSGLDATVFIPLDAAYKMAADSPMKAERALELKPSMISAVMIGLKPGVKPGDAARELNLGIYEISVIEPGKMLRRAHHGLDAAVYSLRAAGLALWPVTCLLMGMVFAMAVNERNAEIGVLRALGAGKGFVFRMVILEAVILAALGAAAGVMTGIWAVIGFSGLIAPALGTPFVSPGPGWTLELAGEILILAIFSAALASLAPAIMASRMEPYAAMRGG